MKEIVGHGLPLFQPRSLPLVQNILMLKKSNVIQHIQQLSDQFSIDELMERLLFIYKIETALEQSKNDQTTPHNKIKVKYQKWLG